jgi:hypothetical protein
MGHQRDDPDDRLGRGPQTGPCRPVRGAIRLLTLRAEESLVLTRMETNIALADLSSGGARQIGAACRGGVPDRPPGVVGEHAWSSMSGPPFPLPASCTTV